MRPFDFLFNKILKSEEQKESDGNDSSFVESYSFDKASRNGKCNVAVLPRSHFVEVPYINQQQYWDCGLACVVMVLNTIGFNECHIEALAELCCTTSTWSVDLAYLLQRFSVSFSYLTVTLGANPNYSLEIFYKEQLANDLVRVDMLFQKAIEAGINIERRSISREEISLLILSGKYIAIMLVNQYKLSHSWADAIFVSGFCDEFEIRDPASSRYLWRRAGSK